MWLILSETDDGSARWAYKGLLNRGLDPIRLVTTRELCIGARWEHRIGNNEISVIIRLADGSKIVNNEVGGVLNLIRSPSPENLILIHPSDRYYVNEELYSFYLSWLYAIGSPIINQPTPHGLTGHWRNHSEWVFLAARAGLPAACHHKSSHHSNAHESLHSQSKLQIGSLQTILVVNGHVAKNNVPLPIKKGCRRLSRLSQTALLGVYFSVESDDKWVFAGATTDPDIRDGGELCLDLLARALKRNTVKEK